MHLYDENGRIQHYDGSLAILEQFYVSPGRSTWPT
jgi:hypothetical protein